MIETRLAKLEAMPSPGGSEDRAKLEAVAAIKSATTAELIASIETNLSPERAAEHARRLTLTRTELLAIMQHEFAESCPTLNQPRRSR